MVPQFNVVLVRSIYPRNIGMCARAVSNMGGASLIIVAPQCELDEMAREGAAGAQDALRSARTYPSLESFFAVEPDGIRVALSARDVRIAANQNLKDYIDKTAAKPTGRPIYFMFGPEDDGLSHEEIALAHHVCHLPTSGEFTSLNLSHAVLLTLYIARAAFPVQAGAQTEAPVSSEKQYFPKETIHNWLLEVGFKLENRHVNAEKVFNRILLENEPTIDELRILEAILQQNIRKLKANKA